MKVFLVIIMGFIGTPLVAQQYINDVELLKSLTNWYVKEVYNKNKDIRGKRAKIPIEDTLEIIPIHRYKIDRQCFKSLECDFLSDDFASCVKKDNPNQDFILFFRFGRSNEWHVFRHWINIFSIYPISYMGCSNNSLATNQNIIEFLGEDIIYFRGSFSKIEDGKVYYYKGFNELEQYGAQFTESQKQVLRQLSGCD